MKTILVVYHTQSGNTLKMAEAVVRGVQVIEGIQVHLKKAIETEDSDLIDCDGLVIASPEYFGYMAGAIKDLFDRTYERLRGHQRIFRKPYAVCVSAGNDGQGALTNIEKICLGFQFKKIQPPIIAKGAVTANIVARCEELGQTIAAGCEAGIY
ncbi:MAG TPA: NAD(P)H-dependent oxidoreductase [Thermodesulfobacteriota bacterium]|nr:NAD(P)H-dependent oxidoreductase [Thermodesulfobacteriota bacterium]